MLTDKDRQEIGIYRDKKWTTKKIMLRETGIFFGKLLPSLYFCYLLYSSWMDKMIPGLRGRPAIHFANEPENFYFQLTMIGLIALGTGVYAFISLYNSVRTFWLK